MKNSIALISLAFVAILVLSCQKTDLNKDDIVVTQGYIDLRITGRSADNELLDESVRYSTFPKDSEEFYSSVYENDSSMQFNLGRFNGVTQSESAFVSFNYDGESTSEGYASIGFRKILEGNTILSFVAETGINCGPAEVVIEKYDVLTGEIGGNFSLQVINPGANNTSRIALIDGEFFIQVRRIKN